MEATDRTTTTGIAVVLRRSLALFAVLRFREFRLYWSGLVAQIIGQQMFHFTVGWLAFELTGSPAYLGIINLLGFVPRISLTLVGGVFADRWDQVRLISLAQATSVAVLLGVATLTWTESVTVWHLMAAAFVLGASQSIDEPARAALFPRLLPDRSHIASAVPLISFAWSSTRVIAPSIAGFVVAAAGADTSFFVAALGAATMVAVLRFVRPSKAAPRPPGNLIRNLIDGVRYVRGHEVFSIVIATSFVAAAFATGYTMMLPVFAGPDVLDIDSRLLGLLYSVTGIGSLVGLATFNLIHSRLRPGTVLIIGLTAFSASLIAFAFSDWYWLSLLLMGLTGVAHIYFQTSVHLILQTLVDDQYRARVMALHGLLWGLVLLSATVLNIAAEFVGPRIALATGASVVLVYVWLFVVRSSALRNVSLTPDSAQPAQSGTREGH